LVDRGGGREALGNVDFAWLVGRADHPEIPARLAPCVVQLAAVVGDVLE